VEFEMGGGMGDGMGRLVSSALGLTEDNFQKETALVKANAAKKALEMEASYVRSVIERNRGTASGHQLLFALRYLFFCD
jgi:hypothetical protein